MATNFIGPPIPADVLAAQAAAGDPISGQTDSSTPVISTSSFWDNLNKAISTVTGAANQAYQATVLSQRPIFVSPGSTIGPGGTVIPAVSTGMTAQMSQLLLVGVVVLAAVFLIKRR